MPALYVDLESGTQKTLISTDLAHPPKTTKANELPHCAAIAFDKEGRRVFLGDDNGVEDGSRLHLDKRQEQLISK